MRTLAAVEEFITSRRAKEDSRETIYWYRQMLSRLTRNFEQLPLAPHAIENYLASLHMADFTLYGHYRALRVFYKWTCRRHHLDNPMIDIEPPRRRKKRPWSLSAAELGYVLAVPLSKRDRALVSLLADTGIRISEALHLIPEDINTDSIVVQGKTGQRELPISIDVREQLLALGTSPVFGGRHGPLTRQQAYKIIGHAFRLAGIPARKWGPHTLRHTFGRQWVINGGDLVSLQRILGHSDIKTTRIYAELDMRDVTLQHHRFTPYRLASDGAQWSFWQGKDQEVKE